MYPVLFTLHFGSAGGFTVGTYGLFYAAGFLLALRLGIAYAVGSPGTELEFAL